MQSRISFRLFMVAASFTVIVLLAVALPSGADAGPAGQFPPPKKPVLKYPNLGSMLDQLVARVATGEATAEEAAADAPLHQGTSVAVTIYLSNNVDGLVSFLENKGGSPRNVGEDYIEAYVPVTLLGQASEQPGVLRVRAITPPQPARTGPALRVETLPAQVPLNDKGELTDFCDQD